MTTNFTTTYHVTEAQIAAAHRFINEQTHQVIFKVESQTTVGVEYTVFYNRVRKSLDCTCKAAGNGIGCWHRRAALAAAAEYRQEIRERNERDMIEFSKEITAECCTSGAYTVQVDPTSSSLDGVTFEVAPSGRLVPMR